MIENDIKPYPEHISNIEDTRPGVPKAMTNEHKATAMEMAEMQGDSTLTDGQDSQPLTADDSAMANDQQNSEQQMQKDTAEGDELGQSELSEPNDNDMSDLVSMVLNGRRSRDQTGPITTIPVEGTDVHAPIEKEAENACNIGPPSTDEDHLQQKDAAAPAAAAADADAASAAALAPFAGIDDEAEETDDTSYLMSDLVASILPTNGDHDAANDDQHAEEQAASIKEHADDPLLNSSEVVAEPTKVPSDAPAGKEAAEEEEESSVEDIGVMSDLVASVLKSKEETGEPEDVVKIDESKEQDPASANNAGAHQEEQKVAEDLMPEATTELQAENVEAAATGAAAVEEEEEEEEEQEAQMSDLVKSVLLPQPVVNMESDLPQGEEESPALVEDEPAPEVQEEKEEALQAEDAPLEVEPHAHAAVHMARELYAANTVPLLVRREVPTSVTETRLLPGVSLAVLEALLDQVKAAGYKVDSMTSREVFKEVILPITQDGRIAYVECLPDDGHQGPHHYFVSHAWGMPFASMVESVSDAVAYLHPYKHAGETYIWVDLLCRRSIGEDGLPFEAAQPLRDAKAAATASTSGTLLCMDISGKVFQLSRILYEAWCSFYYCGGGSRLRVLSTEIITPGHVIEALEKVQLGKSKCISKEELIATVADVRKEGGLTDFRAHLCLALLEATNAEVQDLSQHKEFRLEHLASALHKCGVFAQACGLLEQSELLHAKSAQKMAEQRGSEDGLSAACCLGLAETLMDERKWAEAEVKLKEGRAALKKELGSAGALRATRQLAKVLKKQGKLDEAEPLYRESLKASEAVYGADSANTAAASLQLAVLLQKKKLYQESAELAVRALRINDMELGPVHPTTVQNLTFLRDLSKQARDREAWEQYYKALKERRAQQQSDSTAA
ncbi:hypothetical protein CEUSTIGMA_g4833.t1 [Chlamydomonas eustigma]|uniref:Clu domain-containing protein n=1 Tax=Chlamydomonas eustigma TaxID=1157962 RepID=A0A250X2U1_9CHLO|nr:hypothetical protein CEUSTIGMA_g4833.t1 [Chlamydomonas eustigma]|eukprot:GAX77387.1 hypothetical protein CEUSTIGMA_g4833.t1 [Chlamydomonas eustigma]